MRTPSPLLSIILLTAVSGFFRPSHSAEPPLKPLSRYRPETRGPSGIVWRRQDYRGYVTKAMKRPEFIRRKLQLSEVEFKRAEKLLESGIVRRVLLENRRGAGSSFYVEKDSRRVLIAGPPEPVVALQTMIVDELTFLLGTCDKSSENTLVVLSLVDPIFLETDPEQASQIAEHNYEGVRRILQPGAPNNRRSGKRVQFNRGIGTVTILDLPSRIQKVREYLAMRPYAPRPKTY